MTRPFISLLALFVSSRSNAEWWRPAFFAFLPMCFFFVGAATSRMQREIRGLRTQIVELQGSDLVEREAKEQTTIHRQTYQNHHS